MLMVRDATAVLKTQKWYWRWILRWLTGGGGGERGDQK